MDKEKADMIIYTTEDGLTKVETTFDGDTVWLSIDQMAELFQRDRSVIGKHVRNVFKEGELEKEAVWAKFAYTATDGKVYNVDYDPKAEISIAFFKKVQNKIHYAIHGQTAAEVIYTRADAEKEFMGLTTFTGKRKYIAQTGC